MSRDVTVRLATAADLEALVPRSRALNDHEGITVATPTLAAALRVLVASPELGGAWVIERGGAAIGYAIVTYGFDLEFSGRDAWLTELWIDEGARGGGAGAAALALLEPALRARGVNALHLQVRRENPAMRLYQRAGYQASPRVVMTKTLAE